MNKDIKQILFSEKQEFHLLQLNSLQYKIMAKTLKPVPQRHFPGANDTKFVFNTLQIFAQRQLLHCAS